MPHEKLAALGITVRTKHRLCEEKGGPIRQGRIPDSRTLLRVPVSLYAQQIQDRRHDVDMRREPSDPVAVFKCPWCVDQQGDMKCRFVNRPSTKVRILRDGP